MKEHSWVFKAIKTYLCSCPSNHSWNGFWHGLAVSLSKVFLNFPCTIWNLHPHLRRQHAEDNCVLIRCKFSEWFSIGLLPLLLPHIYWISNCPAVSAKRQILTTKRCLPSFGDHLSPLCLLLWASSTFHLSLAPQSGWGLWDAIWAVRN